ncbi:MAG: SRPBCC domain-containing protein [Chitinophagaceae bacterium]|nr:SRPBCC domain-containing protein [Chitinophagaceae bacterium]
MSNKKQTAISKDASNKKLLVVREFDATPEEVWNAWTQSELLDQWWAPKPWKAKTKTMDFREGGLWLYAMVGPDGDAQYCRVDFETVDIYKTFTSIDAFCDENGVENTDFPKMHWKNEFIKTSTGTRVMIELSFDDEAGLEKVVAMGFNDGFTAALANLDELLAQ